MRTTFTILGFISAIIALALSVLPFGLIAILPAIAAFIFGLIAIKGAKKDGKSTKVIKLIYLITIVALSITTYRSIFTKNKIETDTEFIDRQEQSEEEAIEELEGLDINAGSGD